MPDWIFPPLWLALGATIAVLVYPHATVPRIRGTWRRLQRARRAKRLWVLACAINDLGMLAALVAVVATRASLWTAVVIILGWLALYKLLLFAAHPYIHRAHRLRRAWDRAAAQTAPTGGSPA